VIFLERSPFATAVVTSAMLRTWPVRLDAMKFTLSVRSFQVPPTPFTCAWPPSLPSVPTSRATRVTSEANADKLVHHGVDGVLQLQDLALHFHRDLLGQVAVRHRGGHVGDVAHLARQVGSHRVHESVRSFQVPPTPGTYAWPPSLPSVPTSRATRVTSDEKPQLIHHGIDGVLQLQNLARTSTVILRDKSPFATAVVTSRCCAPAT
jgi:hypothetical protein